MLADSFTEQHLTRRHLSCGQVLNISSALHIPAPKHTSNDAN